MRRFLLFFLAFASPVFAVEFDLSQLDERVPITKPLSKFQCTVTTSGTPKSFHKVFDANVEGHKTGYEPNAHCQSVHPYQSVYDEVFAGSDAIVTPDSTYGEQGTYFVNYKFCNNCFPTKAKITYLSASLSHSESKECPHPDSPDHTFEYDEDGDGVVDWCLDPRELALDDSVDNNCPHDSIVPDYGFSTGDSGNACIVNDDNSAICSMQKQGSVFVASEGNCYEPDAPEPQGQDKPTPPPPAEDSCNIHFGAAIACSADPSEYCDGQGVCDDGCGYVNGSFMCFPDDCTAADSCTLPPPSGGDSGSGGDGDSGSGDGDSGSGDNGNGDNGSGDNSGGDGSSTDTSCTGSDCGQTNVDVEVNVDLDKLLDKGPQITEQDVKNKIDTVTGDYFEEFDRILGQTYKEAGGVEINKDNVTFGGDIVGRLDVKSSCTNPTVPIGLESHTLDICEKAPLITLFLDFIFGMMTVIYFFNRLNQVLSEGGS